LRMTSANVPSQEAMVDRARRWTALGQQGATVWAYTRRARSGALTGLTGVDAPYEPSRAPEVELTPEMDVQMAAEVVLAALGARSSEPA
jgi:hypothetical protein